MAKKIKIADALEPKKIKRFTVQTLNKIGAWAFIFGIIAAVFAGLWPLETWLVSTLIVLGLIVGFLNIETHQTNNFLFASLVLVLISSFGGSLLSQVTVIGDTLASIFVAIVSFVTPAAIIVALKAVYEHAKEDA
ncbi:MAG: hypothetical protein PHO02_05385 [Candidatus Nanoarchaeia archaeon]|nr:hypothetical protein [Candidatus Nanoarchaeia archaeon]